MINIAFKKISYSVSFFMLFFLAISSNVSATSLNGLTFETGHTNTNQTGVYERWAIDEDYGGYVPECGWEFPSIGDIDLTGSIDGNFLYSKNSYKVCNREVQNGNYRFYLAGGIKGQCTSCNFSRTYDSSVYCYDYYSEDLYLKLVAGTATKKYTGVLPQWVINGYDFCELAMPTRDTKLINSGETSYTLKPICNDENAIKSIQVNATEVWLSSAIPPLPTDILINGTTPTYINKEYTSYNEYEQLYYWHGSLSWEAPVNKKCEEITNVTITPSIANGYAYAIVDSINAIYGESNLTLTLNPSEIYPNKAGSPVSSLAIATLVDNDGNPLSGYQINFQSEIIESKGHAHTNTRSPGTIEESCVTDEDGQCSVNYYSSLVAGKDKITAYLSDYPDVKDSKETIVKVPGLYSMSGGMYYILVGSPNSNDPCRSVLPTSQHNENHYGTWNLVYALNQIALQYASQSNDLYINLRINDMSLEWGGLFDIGNDWSSIHGHDGHRRGKNADIGFVGWEFVSLNNNRCMGLNTKKLYRIIRNVTEIPPFVHTDHYHIYVSQ